MATVDELLAGVSTVDKTLVISNDFRTINIPSSVPNLGVEYDDDVLRLDFKMPRYVSDTDLSTFSICINYMNAQRETDTYTVSDVKVYSEYITFSWLVGPTATRYKGDTKFIVCAKTLKSDDVIDKEFNTTIATLPVLEGLEVDESVVTEYSDVIEQWRQELFGIGDTEESSIKAVSQNEQAAIANKGAEVLATIPVDYQTAVSMTDNADRTKADAIICSTEGEIIRVDDSSDDYLRKLNIFGKTTQLTTTGKNLIPTFSSRELYGITMAVDDDGTITLNGTATGGSFSQSVQVNIAPGSYVFSANNPIGIGSDFTTSPYLAIRDADSVWNFNCTFKTPNHTWPVSFTGQQTSILLAVPEGVTLNNFTLRLQLESGSVATDYEPYSGGLASPRPDWPQEMVSIDNPTIDVYGKNLAVQKYALDYAASGINIVTTDNTSEVLLNGIAERLFSHTVLRTGTLPPGTYTASVSGVNIHDGGHDRLYIADYYTGKVYANYLRDGSPKTITLPKSTRLRLDMVFKEDTEYVDRILKIQVEAGSVATDYEPCKTVQSLALNHILPGVPVSQNGNCIDSNGQQWICDEIDFERGVYIQRIAVVECDGTETITREERSDNTYRFVIRFANPITASTENVYDGKCSHFAYGHDPIGNNATDKVMCIWTTGHAYCRYDDITSVEGMVEWLSSQYEAGTPIIMIYPRATPIETPLTAEEIEWFRFVHTNFSSTTVLNDAGTMMKIQYNADTKTWLENLPKATDAQVVDAVNAWLEAHYTNAEGVSF